MEGAALRPRSWSTRRLRPFVVWGVWLAGVVLVLWLSRTSVWSSQVTGVVDTTRYSVTAPVEGRLAMLAVDLNDFVTAGQVLARLGDEEVSLRLVRAKAELARLRADLQRRAAEIEARDRETLAKQRFEATVEARRCQDDLESARLDELQTRAELEEARIRLQGVAVEATRLETLGAQIAAETALLRVQTDRDALRKRIAELEGVVTAQAQRVESARQRLSQAALAPGQSTAHDLVLEPFRQAILTQEAQIESVRLEAAKLVLIAPESGRIETVRARPGEWVASGAVTLTIVDPKVRRILAYVPQTLRGRVEGSTQVRVVRESSPGSPRLAGVLGISPAPVLVPRRLWRVPQVEEWAYQLVVAVHGDEHPGERVSLILEP